MAKDKIEIVAAGNVITVDGNTSPAAPVLTLTMLALLLDITALSGTTPLLFAYLEGSHDKAGPFVEIPYDLSTDSTGTATEGTQRQNARDVVGAGTGDAIDAIGQYTAIYKHVPYRYVRLAWNLTGTTPSFTWGAWLSGA